MSNGTISLEAAIRTCKVDTAYSNKVQSDRFLNPNLMVCPVWSGVDTTGREVCPDSYYTKNAGCNSAEDRVYVENNLRPQYMEYINLSAQGIDAAIYGNTMPWNEVGQSNAELQAVNNVTGNYGLQFGANVFPGCNYYPYEEGMAQEQAALQGVASNTSPVAAQGVYQPGVGIQQQLLTKQFHGPTPSQKLQRGYIKENIEFRTQPNPMPQSALQAQPNLNQVAQISNQQISTVQNAMAQQQALQAQANPIQQGNTAQNAMVQQQALQAQANLIPQVNTVQSNIVNQSLQARANLNQLEQKNNSALVPDFQLNTASNNLYSALQAAQNPAMNSPIKASDFNRAQQAVPNGPLQSFPNGPLQSFPNGPLQAVPNGPLQAVPNGPLQSFPNGPPQSGAKPGLRLPVGAPKVYKGPGHISYLPPSERKIIQPHYSVIW
jgi:hypothetical protein